MGFYVDIGAYYPKIISNTYWFYKRGGRGINIDGKEGFKERFDKYRPNDINIQTIVSSEEKEPTFYSWKDSVYSTVSKERADEVIEKLNFGKPKEIRIFSQRLETILDKHLPADTQISFFSIDAEEHDLEVLRSNNWEKYRPELIIAEDPQPSIEDVLASKITEYLKSNGYVLGYWTPPSVIYKRIS